MQPYIETPENRNRRLEPTCVAKPGKIDRLAGKGMALQDAAGWVFGWVWNHTKHVYRSEHSPPAGYLDPLQLLVWPEQLNTGTIVVPTGHLRYWSCQNHPRDDRIQLLYLTIPPAVTWFHLWVYRFLTIIKFIWWNLQHMFPERRLLQEELNAFNRIAVKEMHLIIIMKVVWTAQIIVTEFTKIFNSCSPCHDTFCSTCSI